MEDTPYLVFRNMYVYINGCIFKVEPVYIISEYEYGTTYHLSYPITCNLGTLCKYMENILCVLSCSA